MRPPRNRRRRTGAGLTRRACPTVRASRGVLHGHPFPLPRTPATLQGNSPPPPPKHTQCVQLVHAVASPRLPLTHTPTAAAALLPPRARLRNPRQPSGGPAHHHAHRRQRAGGRQQLTPPSVQQTGSRPFRQPDSYILPVLCGPLSPVSCTRNPTPCLHSCRSLATHSNLVLSVLSIPLHTAPRLAPHAPQHDPSEYGSTRGPDGRHSGGPFQIAVSPKMRVEELRRIIRVRRD
jgi:hypothetical protein